MFAVAAFFGANGVHIRIDSESPRRAAPWAVRRSRRSRSCAPSSKPRGAGRAVDRRAMALTAHAIEESVAGRAVRLPGPVGGRCSPGPTSGAGSRSRAPVSTCGKWWCRRPGFPVMADHLLIAYVGVTHASSDVNGRWVRQFVAGRQRSGVDRHHRVHAPRSPTACALGGGRQAAELMQRETAIRRRMTPDVLEPVGRRLVAAARRSGCGARFTGAGGGGCLWALGEAEAIQQLAPVWRDILARRPGARLLSAPPTAEGLRVEAPR